MRFLPHLLWLSGLLVLVYALGSGSAAALPYPDPTPELLAVQRHQLQTAALLGAAGGLLFLAGVVWAFRRRAAARRARAER